MNLRRLIAAALAVLALIALDTSAAAQEIPREVLVNNSLAASKYQNKEYAEALPYLRWLLKNAPTVYNGERIHRRAFHTYAALSDSTDDPALKAAYLDTALTILRTAPKTFEDAGAEFDLHRWELDFGNFIVRYGNEIAGLEDEAVDHFRKAYDLDPVNTDPYYIRLIIEGYQRLDRKDDAVAFMDDVESRFPENAELLQFIAAKRDEILVSPEDRIPFLESKLAENPDDVETVRELFGIYAQLSMSAEMERTGERLLELDPTPETYRQVAEIKAKNGENQDALNLYRKALELAPDDDGFQRDVEFNIASLLYEMDRLEDARTHARRALSHDRTFGRADMLIGDILVKAVQESEFDRTDRAVYWLAADYYDKAASSDPSLATEARKKVQEYTAYMPTTEDKFFEGWKVGAKYEIDYGRYAWVNETTHVR